ncbi:branched-chain amino acid aminotransferase [Desulfonema ishimotonii]|uniref:branched-chain-amino-acid transaminase n=1 Tax=Desulfonema ishimotonii TaxID=45657 RepID=A0A401G113_9BACT|nr:aminotransferase class IV [Desulfonema ishimotonii]GBC62900.1 branched-chain amino acid aminotransferase [Desulfonema ishimotonii]
MKQEAVSEYFIVDRKLRATDDMKIFDRIGGDALYEVVKVVDGIPLFFEAHMARLRQSGKKSAIEIQKKDAEISEEIAALVQKNRCDHINVKLVRTELDGKEIFLTYFIRSEYPGRNVYARGIHTILFRGERENPNIKTVSASFRERVQAAREKTGAYEALLTDRNGYISEGSRSNIFFVKGGAIHTPPAGTVLMGVTRHYVMAICRELGITVNERTLHRDELTDIEGAFITGTTVDVLPIASIDHRKIRSVSDLRIQKIIKGYEKEIRFYTEMRKKSQALHLGQR